MEIKLIGYKGKVGFPGGSDGKASAGNAGDVGSIPKSGRSPGKGMAYPLQCSHLENSWTEEPGRLQPIGSPRVRHDLTLTTWRKAKKPYLEF